MKLISTKLVISYGKNTKEFQILDDFKAPELKFETDEYTDGFGIKKTIPTSKSVSEFEFTILASEENLYDDFLIPIGKPNVTVDFSYTVVNEKENKNPLRFTYTMRGTLQREAENQKFTEVSKTKYTMLFNDFFEKRKNDEIIDKISSSDFVFIVGGEKIAI